MKINNKKGLLSISDDDLCSDCLKLSYNPGGLSKCHISIPYWPAYFTEDGYSVECLYFKKIAQLGDNLIS